MRGFKAVSIEKQQIKFVEIEKEDQHTCRINLKNNDKIIVGRIEGELLSKKTIGVNELAQKIDLWINS